MQVQLTNIFIAGKLPEMWETSSQCGFTYVLLSQRIILNKCLLRQLQVILSTQRKYYLVNELFALPSSMIASPRGCVLLKVSLLIDYYFLKCHSTDGNTNSKHSKHFELIAPLCHNLHFLAEPDYFLIEKITLKFAS